MWDAEVDLVCIGAGIGGLAGAIAAVDAGVEVIVADTMPHPGRDVSSVATRRRVGSLRGWLDQGVADVDTEEYFCALSEGLDAPSRHPDAARVPTLVASTWSADERSVEPFVGSAIRAWDQRCLSSPYGMVYSSVFGRNSTRMRSSSGESVEVMPLGDVDWHDGLGEHDLLDWMAAQARRREVEVLAASPLQRLVFEDDLVVGAVLDTSDGPFAVRARHGVTVSPSEHESAPGDRVAPARGERVQVCLVGRSASRFGRVELLTTAPPAVSSRPVCAVPAGRLRENLRVSRQVPSDAWRGGKMHGHPPLG